jgi:uncharacterized protein (DUF1778 family)
MKKPKKTGRPKATKAERGEWRKVVSMRLSLDELERICQAANLLKQPYGEFIRESALKMADGIIATKVKK